MSKTLDNIPETYAAESVVVRPDPPTRDAISRVFAKLAMAAEIASAMGNTAGGTFLDGFAGGLSLALDEPDAVPLVLAVFDNNRGQTYDGDEPIPANKARIARAMTIRELADAALHGATGKAPGSSDLLN